MGEIADDLIDRMWGDDNFDDGYSPFTGRMPSRKKGKPPAKFYDQRARGFDANGSMLPKPGKAKPRRSAKEEAVHAREYPGAHTDPTLIPVYEEKLFDMSFFPKIKPKAVTPTPQWDGLFEEEAPF